MVTVCRSASSTPRPSFEATPRRFDDLEQRSSASVDDFGGDFVVLIGGVGKVAAEIDAWREAGGTHASVVTMGLGLQSVDDHLEYIASVADALGVY
jgi:predicted SpoU family rRNA methylase